MFDEGDAADLGKILYLELYPKRLNAEHLDEEILRAIRSINVLRAAQAKYRYICDSTVLAQPLSSCSLTSAS